MISKNLVISQIHQAKKTPKYKTFTTSELKELSKKCGISLTHNKAKKPKTKAELLGELDIYYLK